MDRQKESGRRERGREFLESNVPSATNGHLRKREGSGGRGGGRKKWTQRVVERTLILTSRQPHGVAPGKSERERERGGGGVLTLALTLVYCEGHQPIHKGGGGGGGEY